MFLSSLVYAPKILLRCCFKSSLIVLLEYKSNGNVPNECENYSIFSYFFLIFILCFSTLFDLVDLRDSQLNVSVFVRLFLRVYICECSWLNWFKNVWYWMFVSELFVFLPLCWHICEWMRESYQFLHLKLFAIFNFFLLLSIARSMTAKNTYKQLSI